jgi:hypothetical protein
VIEVIYDGVTVELIENSSRREPPRSFAGHTIQIDAEHPIVKTGADGYVGVGLQPTHIMWLDGQASELDQITITAADGWTIAAGSLCRTFNPPCNVTGGVTFVVL